MAHEMTMNGPVTMLNAFIAPPAAQAARLPDHCCVHGVSPLLRLLLDQAVDLPALYDVEGRDGKLMALLIAEIAAMPRLHLHAPLPEDPRLARACLRLFAAPLDRREPGRDGGRRRHEPAHFHPVVPRADRRQLRRVAAAGLPAGGDRAPDTGQSVTRVALDLGYASPSAFASAFRRVLGATPSAYLDIG